MTDNADGDMFATIEDNRNTSDASLTLRNTFDALQELILELLMDFPEGGDEKRHLIAP